MADKKVLLIEKIKKLAKCVIYSVSMVWYVKKRLFVV